MAHQHYRLSLIKTREQVGAGKQPAPCESNGHAAYGKQPVQQQHGSSTRAASAAGCVPSGPRRQGYWPLRLPVPWPR